MKLDLEYIKKSVLDNKVKVIALAVTFVLLISLGIGFTQIMAKDDKVADSNVKVATKTAKKETSKKVEDKKIREVKKALPTKAVKKPEPGKSESKKETSKATTTATKKQEPKKVASTSTKVNSENKATSSKPKGRWVTKTEKVLVKDAWTEFTYETEYYVLASSWDNSQERRFNTVEEANAWLDTLDGGGYQEINDKKLKDVIEHPAEYKEVTKQVWVED